MKGPTLRPSSAESTPPVGRRQLDLRGRGLLGEGRFGPEYWQDHLPVREAPTVAGHSVRQLYLDAGAVDVAVATGDQPLLDAVIRRWTDMVATRAYVTGGRSPTRSPGSGTGGACRRRSPSSATSRRPSRTS